MYRYMHACVYNINICTVGFGGGKRRLFSVYFVKFVASKVLDQYF